MLKGKIMLILNFSTYEYLNVNIILKKRVLSFIIESNSYIINDNFL